MTNFVAVVILIVIFTYVTQLTSFRNYYKGPYVILICFFIGLFYGVMMGNIFAQIYSGGYWNTYSLMAYSLWQIIWLIAGILKHMKNKQGI